MQTWCVRGLDEKRTAGAHLGCHSCISRQINKAFNNKERSTVFLVMSAVEKNVNMVRERSQRKSGCRGPRRGLILFYERATKGFNNKEINTVFLGNSQEMMNTVFDAMSAVEGNANMVRERSRWKADCRGPRSVLNIFI